MKIISTILLCALIACGGGNKAAPSNTTTAKATGETGDVKTCKEEVALSCPDGQIDQCIKERAESDAKIKKMEEDKSDEAGGTGTAMALDEGRISAMPHKCVPK
jgi:hypothetical protein